MLHSQIDLLIEEYSRRKCAGIAAFLELLTRVSVELQHEIFAEFCVEEFDVERYKVQEPFEFFAYLLECQKSKPVFLDEGLSNVERACQDYADYLDHSGQTVQ